MVFSVDEFIASCGLDRDTLEVWLAEGWLIVSPGAQEPSFSEKDVARVTLIRELQNDFGVNQEGVGIVLNLLDQVHGLRRVVRHLLESSRRDPGSL